MATVRDHTALQTDASWWWGAYTGRPVFLTFSFERAAQPGLADEGYPAAFINSFHGFTTAEMQAARDALNEWAQASGIYFIEAPPGQGDIRFAKYDFSLDPENDDAAGFAYYPYVLVGDDYAYEFELGGDIFIDLPYASDVGLLLHEIGHALGFKHPFEDDPILDPDLDRRTVTVMSYDGDYPVGGKLGRLDIDAVKSKYGGPNADGTHVASWDWNASRKVLTQNGAAGADAIRGVGAKDVIYGHGGDDTLFGGGERDTLLGGAGLDRLFGLSGRDSLAGEAGNDTIVGGLDDDFASGGEGDDSLGGDEGDDTLEGDAGADTLWGWLGDDKLVGGDGEDTQFGSAGNDTLIGEAGSDYLDGDAGADVIYLYTQRTAQSASTDDGVNTAYAGAGADIVHGTAGFDWLFGEDGADTLQGFGGGDHINGGGGVDTALINRSALRTPFSFDFSAAGSGAISDSDGAEYISIEVIEFVGGRGDETVTGGARDESLAGGGGADKLNGAAGNDTLRGGGADDTLIGLTGDDEILGDGGNDQIFAGYGDDLAEGGGGADFIRTGPGADTLFGGAGDDVLGASNRSDLLRGERGNDLLLGSNGNDRLFGDDGEDTLLGGNGRDRLQGGDDADRLVGGGGADTAEYSEAGEGVAAYLWSGRGVAGDAEGDIFVDIENLTGSAFDDLLAGDDGVHRLSGGDGDDTLIGREGADTLVGGDGDDVMHGGDGADYFVFNHEPGAADTISDIEAGVSGADTIRLNGFGAGLDSFGEVLAASKDVKAGVLIDLGDGASLLLAGVDVADLAPGDFVFG